MPTNQRHHKRLLVAHHQHRFAKGWRKGGNHIEHHGRGDDHQHARQYQCPVAGNRTHNFCHRRVMFTLAEGVGFFQHTADIEQEWHDQAAHHKGNTPAPLGHFIMGKQMVQRQTQQRSKNHSDLLTARLPAHKEPFASFGATSARYTDTPPNSTPAEKPCSRRPSRIRTGAAAPSVA